MSLPSCNIPPVFSAFNRQRQMASRMARSEAVTVRDTFLDPSTGMSSRKAVSLFTAGLASAFVGRWALRSLFRKSGQIADEAARIRFETNNILKAEPGKRDERNVAQSFSEALSSIYRLALADPEQRGALLAYMGSSVLGYISGSAVQGAQETWVRREETKIRAHLINKLQDVFRQSIRIKNEQDNQLRETARGRIREMLDRYGVPGADELVMDRPQAESLKVQRNYFYEPTHRTQFGASGTAGNESGMTLGHPGLEAFWKRAQGGVVYGLGVCAGLTLQGFVKLFTAPAEGAKYKGQTIVYETIHVRDKEAWWINGIKNRRNFSILLGFFAMSAGARIGKLLIDGLREIEVTRINARTELDYQTHNWLTQDPGFHHIAETEALEDSLRRLERDLPYLKANPVLLQQRIQTILTNVGRNSAPKYFPMTPPVGLVVARS